MKFFHRRAFHRIEPLLDLSQKGPCDAECKDCKERCALDLSPSERPGLHVPSVRSSPTPVQRPASWIRRCRHLQPPDSDISVLPKGTEGAQSSVLLPPLWRAPVNGRARRADQHAFSFGGPYFQTSCCLCVARRNAVSVFGPWCCCRAALREVSDTALVYSAGKCCKFVLLHPRVPRPPARGKNDFLQMRPYARLGIRCPVGRATEVETLPQRLCIC